MFDHAWSGLSRSREIRFCTHRTLCSGEDLEKVLHNDSSYWRGKIPPRKPRLRSQMRKSNMFRPDGIKHLPASGTDFNIIFSAAFDFVKRIIVAHGMCTESKLDEFLCSRIVTEIDYLVGDLSLM